MTDFSHFMSQSRNFHFSCLLLKPTTPLAILLHIGIIELSGIPGLSIASNPEPPIVFLELEKSTSSKADLDLLQAIANRVSNY